METELNGSAHTVGASVVVWHVTSISVALRSCTVVHPFIQTHMPLSYHNVTCTCHKVLQVTLLLHARCTRCRHLGRTD